MCASHSSRGDLPVWLAEWAPLVCINSVCFCKYSLKVAKLMTMKLFNIMPVISGGATQRRYSVAHSCINPKLKVSHWFL